MFDNHFHSDYVIKLINVFESTNDLNIILLCEVSIIVIGFRLPSFVVWRAITLQCR